MKQKIVIYTAFSGSYDNLITPKYISKDFDYICFTDKKIKNPGIWEIRQLEDIKQDLVRTARYHKLFPNKILSEYKYSIWIDSNTDIIDNLLEKRIKQLIKENKKISVGIHFERNCIYQEAKACIEQQKDDPEIILREINFLKKQKYPKNNGLFETNIIFREHNNSKIIKLMEDWWYMITNFSRRDQLSFNYALWKNKLNCIPLFSQNMRSMVNNFSFKDHNKKIVSTLYIDQKNGFNNDDFVQKVIVFSKNKFKIKFNLEEFSKIKQFKFNLFVNQFCKLKINKIILKNQDKIKKINFSNIEYVHNGNLLKSNFIDFQTFKPQIFFSIKNKLQPKSITIYGCIQFYNVENYLNEKNNNIKQLENENVQENKKLQLDLNISNQEKEKLQLDLNISNQEKEKLQLDLNISNQEKEKLQLDLNISNQEKEKLQSDLNKIQLSKTYKVWQKYNKIKKLILLK